MHHNGARHRKIGAARGLPATPLPGGTIIQT
jgi:hypothetical protein